jgi:hypothetical protein
VKDEVLDKVIQLFQRKPVWKQTDLLANLKKYDPTLVKYILQNAISMGFQLKDKNGRIGRLEAKNDLFAFAMGPNDTLLDRLIPKIESASVPIEKRMVEPEEEEEEEEVPAELEVKQERFIEKVNSHSWPEYARTFSPEVLEWYYVDHILSKKEKITRVLDVLSEDFDNAPPYAKPLLVYNDEDDSYFFVLGSGQFYNSDYDEFTPIAEQKDSYIEWTERLKQKYIDSSGDIFATLKEGTLTFNVDEKTLPIKRASRSKNIGGRSCTTYKVEFLDAFAEWLGVTFPKSVSQKPQRCMYIDLLVRKAILEKKSGVVWFTPEEWSILTEDEHRGDLRKKLKE